MTSTPTSMTTPDWLEVNRVSLRYFLTGTNGDTVVLIHEMGMTLESWDYIAPTLENSHRVLRYDLHGFGLSEKIRHSVSFVDHAADLASLLETLQITTPVIVIGGGLGGAIALQFAAQYPQLVKTLVALTPAVDVPEPLRAGALASLDDLRRVGVRERIVNDTDFVYPPAIRNNPHALARYRALQLAPDERSLAASMQMVLDSDFSEVYPRVQCPTLIVASSMFPPRPPTMMQAIAEQIPGAEFAVLATGHFMPIQSPELLLPLLQAFISKQS